MKTPHIGEVDNSADDSILFAQAPGYNSYFNRTNGHFVRWGKTTKTEDDPQWCPIGPEILDLEISRGSCQMACPFCYKKNGPGAAVNMTFETFKDIFDRMSMNLTQIAFGITDLLTNPDFFKMMEYCRENGVIPNFTTSGLQLDVAMAKKISKLAGAVAVSVYPKEINAAYNAIKNLTDQGMEQINIHLMISQQTLRFVYMVLDDLRLEDRLSKLNAVVFLGLKPKGRGENKFNVLSQEDFGALIDHCFEKDIRFGFDSCSAQKFERAIDQSERFSAEKKTEIKTLSESCESGLFSSYIDCDGKFWPCSFSENHEEFSEGLPVLEHDSFYEIWTHPKVEYWRQKLLNSTVDGVRPCLLYEEINI